MLAPAADREHNERTPDTTPPVLSRVVVMQMQVESLQTTPYHLLLAERGEADELKSFSEGRDGGREADCEGGKGEVPVRVEQAREGMAGSRPNVAPEGTDQPLELDDDDAALRSSFPGF